MKYQSKFMGAGGGNEQSLGAGSIRIRNYIDEYQYSSRNNMSVCSAS